MHNNTNKILDIHNCMDCHNEQSIISIFDYEHHFRYSGFLQCKGSNEPAYLKGLNQAKNVKKSVSLLWLPNKTI